MRWAMVSCTISVLVTQQAPLLAVQEACTPGELRTDSTPTCISIEWDVTGDSDHDAGCGVQFREAGSAEWKEALPLFRVDYQWWYHTERAETPFNMFAGSIMFLKPGQDYEVRLDLADPDGGEATKSVTQQHLVLKAGSEAVDAGAIVPNISDDFVGKAPDLGAYECGGEMSHYGPRQQ